RGYRVRLAVDVVPAGLAARYRRVDVLRAEERAVAIVAAGFVRERVRLRVRAVVANAGLGARAVDSDADEVRRPKGGRLRRLGRRAAVHVADVASRRDRVVLEHGVRDRDIADVTAGARVADPRGGRVLAAVGDHVRQWVRRRDGGRPVLESGREGRDGAVVVIVRVRDGDPHPVGVETGQRGEDATRGVRDEDRVVLVQHRALALQEVEQVRHLLEIGRHARDVAPQVHVVELEIDDVLYVTAGRFEMARIAHGG